MRAASALRAGRDLSCGLAPDSCAALELQRLRLHLRQLNRRIGGDGNKRLLAIIRDNALMAE